MRTHPLLSFDETRDVITPSPILEMVEDLLGVQPAPFTQALGLRVKILSGAQELKVWTTMKKVIERQGINIGRIATDGS